MTIKVGVVGATGYAGAELVRILCGHPGVKLAALTSRQYAGMPFQQVYTAMTGIVDHICQDMDVGYLCEAVDVVILALPHKIPMQYVPEFLEKGVKVIDLSADFRFNNPDVYEAHYQPHMARAFLREAVYGLSEVYAEAIRNASLIGNPGCYPTSILLPLIPLLKNGLLDVAGLVADSKSGVSGAGRSPSLGVHFCEVHESFKAYKVAEHRHNPEIDEILSLEAGAPTHITFVPHLVPMSRGMLTTLYGTVEKNIGLKEIRNCLADAYAGCPFIRLYPDGQLPETRFVRGTNFCDIGVKFDAISGRVILVSAIDNLVKGAAGQAVQNMNIMMGLNEETGLMNIPYPI